MKSCRNCDKPLLYDADFCHVCGQKYTDGKHPLSALFAEFMDAIFSFESRTLRTLSGLFSPSFLSKEYFAGRQVRYMHPLRIFLLSAAIFLAVFGFRLSNYLSEKADNMSLSLHEFHVTKATLGKMDSIYQDFKMDYPESISEQDGAHLMTCFEEVLLKELDFNMHFTISGDGGGVREIPVEEAYEGDLDTLAEKYDADTPVKKMLLAQMIKFTKSPNGFIQATLGNLIWMILLLMPAIALVLKLLYFRRQKFFIEHLVFSFHIHAFAFFALAFHLSFFSNNWSLLLLTYFLIFFYFFLAMKNYYGQGAVRTFFKWTLLLFGYLFIFVMFFGLNLGASFATF